jgi:hypothetical protein
MNIITSKFIASGVIAATLLTAAPAFADSGNGNNGLHRGVFAKILKENRQDRREDRKDDRNEKKHATSTTATTTKSFVVEGTLTAINGTTLTVQGPRGAVYTVNGSGAAFVGHENVAIGLNAFKVNDKVAVTGTLSGSTIIATKVKDKSDMSGKVSQAFKAGIVTGINGTTVTIGNFGSTGTTTFVTNSSTKYKVNGTAASSSALSLGSHVLVLGTTSAGSTSVNASVVVILTEGLNWIRHFWR